MIAESRVNTNSDIVPTSSNNKLVYLLHFAVVAIIPEIFYPDCTFPDDEAGIVAGPDMRGTVDIVHQKGHDGIAFCSPCP